MPAGRISNGNISPPARRWKASKMNVNVEISRTQKARVAVRKVSRNWLSALQRTATRNKVKLNGSGKRIWASEFKARNAPTGISAAREKTNRPEANMQSRYQR